MSKDEIRIQYSGFIIFAAQVVGVVTGVIFTLLLTRNMTQQEYGIWSNIFDWMGYFTVLSGLFPFWVTRFVARGKEGAIKTGLLANLIVGLVSVAVYLPVISVVTRTLAISGAYMLVYLVGSLQLVNLYLISLLESCLRAVKPQTIGYGFLIEEACKVVLAYVFIVGLHQLFLGAMLSFIIASSVQALYYLRLLRGSLRGLRIQWNYLKEWLKGSTAILYNSVGTQAAAFTIILLFYYGGQAARGDYQAAATFANVIGYSSFLAFALYPKLLSRQSFEGVALALRTVLMFSIPMAMIVITLSQSLLTVLRVTYGSASPVLILLTLDTLVLLLSQFYSTVIFGVERLDEDAKIPLNKLVRSRIFKVFTLPYIQAAIALPAAYYALTRLAAGQPVEAAMWVIAINIVVHAGTFLELYAMMRKSVKIPVPGRSIAKYLFASSVPATLLYLGPHPGTLVLTFGTAMGGLAVYAVVLLAIDKEARHLIVLITREIREILRGHAHEAPQASIDA